MNLKELIGSGEKITLFILPFLVAGLGLNAFRPEWFSVGGPQLDLTILSIIMLSIGIVIWLWSALLILTKTSKNKLITTGPYALVKHPLYINFSFLVLPWFGFLCNSWLGIVIGCLMYAGSRKYSPEEEKKLAEKFGSKWEEYKSKVLLPWL